MAMTLVPSHITIAVNPLGSVTPVEPTAAVFNVTEWPPVVLFWST